MEVRDGADAASTSWRRGRADGAPRRLAAPPTTARAGGVRVGARPQRHRPGGGRVRRARDAVRAPDPRRRCSRCDGTVVAQRRRRRRVSSSSTRRSSVVAEPVAAPPFELRRPAAERTAPHAARPCRGVAASSRRAARSRDSPRRRSAGFRATLDDRGLHRDPHTRRSSPRPPRAAPTCSRSTGSGAAPPGAEPAVLQADRWSACSSGSTRSAPVFRAEPHDTARHLAEYVSLDVEIGFIPDHRDVMAVLRVGPRRHGRRPSRERAHAALTCSGWRSPTFPPTSPSSHFDEAQELIEASRPASRRVGEPDLAPADERWLGEWAPHEHGSDFLFVTGYPMAKRPFYTHPDPTTRPRPTASTCCSAGSSWSPAASGSTATTTTLAALDGTRPRPRSTATSRRSATACPPTAASPSASSAGSPASPAPPTSEVTLFPRDLHRLTP